MKIKYCPKFIIVLCILTGAGNIVIAQEQRSITSDDFVNQRPAAAKTKRGKKVAGTAGKGNLGTKSKNWKYKLIPVETAPPQKSIPASTKEGTTDIGVTFWKLRPPLPIEKNLLLLPVLLEDKKTQQMWLSERVNADTVFQSGDKVRLALESYVEGFLYVIGRESYTNGSVGEPYKVFPALSTDDNSVRPGMLIDIPDQNENWPYFNINPQKPNYIGERLTVIISRKPLEHISIGTDGKLQIGSEFADLERGAKFDIYRRTDMSDKIYSTSEAESSCGVKKRELQREHTPGRPCGVNSRELTRDEPQPQTIFRFTGAAGQPAVVFVKLAVR